MKRFPILCSTALLLITTAWAQKAPDNFILVEGAPAKETQVGGDRPHDGRIPAFYLGKYEVTQKEWTDVMGSNPSQFKGDTLPVENVSWYDCVEYCNQRSLKEGLKPFYTIDKEGKDPANVCELDSIKWTVTINAGANGYRLPFEREWEYAARGAQKSKGYAYSGSNDADEVAWYWKNSGDAYLNDHWRWPRLERNHCRTHPVGSKAPNELGVYDMSGNVREWCFEWYVDPDIKTGTVRVQKGGGWIGDVSCCDVSFRGGFEANGKGPDQGFRLCRNK